MLQLLAFFAQVVMASPRQSLTADEPVSIGAGYSYWTTGDWRLQSPVAHPPAIHLLLTWPLLLRPRLDVTTQPGWQEANLTRFVRQVVPRLGPLEATAFATRAPNMLLAMLLAALVFRWTSDWFGGRAGLVALALLAFDPNVIAHAQLATTDVGVTAFGFDVFGTQRVVLFPDRFLQEDAATDSDPNGRALASTAAHPAARAESGTSWHVWIDHAGTIAAFDRIRRPIGNALTLGRLTVTNKESGK